MSKKQIISAPSASLTPENEAQNVIDASAPEEFTLLSALEVIITASYGSKLEDANLAEAESAIAYVCGRTGLNRMQAILFAVCVENHIT